MFPDDNFLTFSEIGQKYSFQRVLKMTRILRKINEKIPIAQFPDQKRRERVRINSEARSALRAVGNFLLDASRLKRSIIIPNNGEELEVLVPQLLEAYVIQTPIPLFTSFCPDWSRDKEGRYNFKSLGGGVSFIAEKFFSEAKPLLSAFREYGIPYAGTLIFANWGLEIEINARDTYGRELSQADIQACFASTLAATDERLLDLQQGEDSALFLPYRIVPMTAFFKEQGVDSEVTYREQEIFFQANTKGTRLVDELDNASREVNKKRLGLGVEENKRQVIQNLAEYATLGQAFGSTGIIIAAESYTSTRAYNLPRHKKLPVFFLKGSLGLNEGVNTL